LSDVLLRARNGAADSELEVVELDRSLLGSEFTRTGTTFDGRDLFSPAAGKLAAGARLSDLGSALSPLELVTLELHHDPNETRVRAVDVYGNVITDAPALQSSSRVIGNQGRPIPFGSTYADGAPGELIAVRGSFGTIELAINRGSAADLLACRVGDLFQLEKAGS
jgi:S-adenosylmethionine hydrolase